MISATKRQKLPLVEADGNLSRSMITESTREVFPAKAASVASPEIRPETLALLACVRARFASENVGEVSSLIADVDDWHYLIDAASYHGVLPLIQQSLTAADTAVPPDVLENIQLKSRANAQNNLHLTRALLLLLNAFEAKSIAAVPYKGPILAAQAYGNLSLRQFCDLDILVRQYDVLKAMDVLTEQGYRLQLPPDQVTPIPQLLKSKKDFRFVSADQRVVVELHWRLAGKHFYFPFSLDDLWPQLRSMSLSGTEVRTIPAEELLVILCAHGSKHLWIRLLWICDVAELLRANPNLDWDRVMRRARKCGSQRMLLLGLHLAQTVLGSVLPTTVTRAIRSDRTVRRLGHKLMVESITNDKSEAQTDSHSSNLYPLFIRMRERLREKFKLAFQYARILFRAAITPKPTDRHYFDLPSSFRFLYYVVRPFRLIGRSVVSNAKLKPALATLGTTIPFRRQLFRALRPMRPPKTIYKHLKDDGPFRVQIDDTHAFLMHHHGYGVETELFWRGLLNGNQDQAIRVWSELCKGASTIFDIGSNLGIFSLVAKTLNPRARVVGFEPVRHLNQKFRRNCDLNGFDVECPRLAISNTDGERELYIASGNIMTASLQNNSSRKAKELVKTSRLDTFIKQHSIDRIDLMKIDVESYEPQVLDGMGAYLQEMHPTMIIEILDDQIGAKVESLLNCSAYLFYCMDEQAGLVRQEHLTVQGHSRHSRNFLLCEPATAAALGLQ